MEKNDFSKSIDRVLSGKYPYKDLVKVREISKLLIDVGFDNNPIFITQRHLKNVMMVADVNHNEYHNLSREFMDELPNILQNPAFILKSYRHQDRIILVSDRFDYKKDPIIAILQNGGSGYYENKFVQATIMNSIYGRVDFNNFLKTALINNELIYYDKEKSHDLLTQVGKSYPELLANHDSNTIIRYLNENVNHSTQNNLKNTKNIEEIDIKEQLLRQKLLELGKSKDVVEKDAKLLLPLAEAQLNYELAQEGKQIQYQNVNQSTKEPINTKPEKKNQNINLKEKKS